MKFLIITCVATYLNFVQGESCSTPGRSPGNCITIYNCEPLLTLARSKTRTQADVEFIRNSQCGYEGKNPKVCCPLADQPSNDFCFTPDAQEGRCVEQNSCQHLTSLANNEENRAFIHNSKCGENRVCCGNHPPNLGPAPNGQCQSIAPQYPRSGCCGVESNPGDRIVGGEDASIFEYPWMALIEYATRRGETKLWCGGSLISSRYVLTAGHCVVGPVLNSGTPRSVRLGEHDTSNALTTQDCQPRPGGGQACNDGAISILIEKIIPHENYNANHKLKRDDIALLRLKEMAPYTLYIKPICLPQVDVTLSNPPDLGFFVAGWGAVNETHSKSNIKQYVDVPYITKEGCQPSYTVNRRNVPLWEGQICAGGEPNKDSCRGDSGGPLMYKKATKRYHEVIGVVSFGPTPCGIEDVPGVYTKVYNYLPWIRKNIVP